MEDPRFRIQPSLRQEWIRFRQQTSRRDAFLRAGVAGAYLPRLRLDVPHLPQGRLSGSVPACVSMVLRYWGREVDPDWLAFLLRTDEERGTPGERLEWLRAWGVRVDFPRDLQFFRDATASMNTRMGDSPARLVYRWEERWLRYLRTALRDGVPPVLFVDLGRLYPGWRGLDQPHAVVLSGGDGRQAWIQDPARADGPVRVGLSTLMDALLPGEPLAALLSPGRAEPLPELSRERGDGPG